MFSWLWGRTPAAAPATPPKHLLLTFTSPPTRDTVQDFEEEWSMFGPGEVPLVFREQTARTAEWGFETELREDMHFDAVANVCERWFADGRLKAAKIVEVNWVGERKEWDLRQDG